METLAQYKTLVDGHLAQFPLVLALEATTGIPRSLLIGAGTGATAAMILFNIAGSLISNLVGFLYPAYCSFKALETPRKDDDAQWLTYWVVFAFLSMMYVVGPLYVHLQTRWLIPAIATGISRLSSEFFADILLYWLPFYFILKTGLLIWLYLPQTRGAEIAYKRVLRPFLLGQEIKVDQQIEKIKKAAAKVVGGAITETGRKKGE